MKDGREGILYSPLRATLPGVRARAAFILFVQLILQSAPPLSQHRLVLGRDIRLGLAVQDYHSAFGWRSQQQRTLARSAANAASCAPPPYSLPRFGSATPITF